MVVQGGKCRARLTHSLAARFVCVTIWGMDKEGMKHDRVIRIPGLGGFHLLKDDGQTGSMALIT